ncbi:MAG: hypothetical protein CVV10_04230 [Gammaproteobacteria bacterium HGW-Gammaproteobacteria-14]|nr:MAG: hypothetical protein CVV10_04230 [Gammaproteobacteria bacterium HGW-Gammaproteobacteria-14]
MKLSTALPKPSLILMALIVPLFLLSGCGGGSDKTRPEVSATYPADNATSIPVNHKVTVTFSREMKSSTIDNASFTVTGADEPALTGTVTLNTDSNTATFSSSSTLTPNTEYTAKVTSGAESTNGKSLDSEYIWSFTSGDSTDSTAPTVLLQHPADTAKNVVLNTLVSATFSESIDAASVNSSIFTLAPSSNLTAMISGKASLNPAGTTLTFTPSNNLQASTSYTATITTGVMDNAIPANPLASPSVWSFRTGNSVSNGPGPIALGTAANFVILSKTGITNVPTSAVTGHIGSSPITSAAIDVTCTEITGTIYGADQGYTGSGDTSCFLGGSAANTLVAIAVLDMGAAYEDAAARTTPDFTELHGGDLSGKTLTPGLYKWGTGVLISTDMTFSGSSGDVWILQIAGDLTVESLARVTLSGGAKAKNIFWQIGGSSGAIINTDAHVAGVLLTQKAITLATGASITGRLLSQTETTLQQNVVTQPVQ